MISTTSSVIISLTELKASINDFIIENDDRIRVENSVTNKIWSFRQMVEHYRDLADTHPTGTPKRGEVFSEYKQIVSDIIDEFTYALVNCALHAKFKSVPDSYQRGYDDICTKYVFSKTVLDTDSWLIQGSRDEGMELFDPLYIQATQLLNKYELDEWSMVDYTISMNVLVLNVGESIKNEVFDRLFGNRRWEHAEFSSTGKVVDGTFNLRVIPLDE